MNLVVGELGKENCSCSICTNLLEDANVLKCEHSFCKKCLDKLIYTPEKNLKKKVKCPFCRVDFDPSKDIKAPGLFQQNQLNLIKLKCEFESCGKIVPYNIFETHKNGCLFNPYSYTRCEHCKKDFKQIDTKKHQNDCIDYLRNALKKSPIIKDGTIFIPYRNTL